MLYLRKYKSDDADTIIQWVNDEISFRQWVADRYQNFPISSEDMNLYYKNFGENNYIFSAVDESNKIIGHFTLRYPKKDNKKTLRLGFVIIDNKIRGKGFGKNMINEAVRYAFYELNADEVTLGVFENNIKAFNCYKSCGFTETGYIDTHNCSGEIWNCIEMHILKPSC